MKLLYCLVINIAVMPLVYCMADGDKLCSAIKNNDRALVKVLLDKEPGIVNKQNPSGLALTCAITPSAYTINTKIVELLLSRGADPYLKNYKRCTIEDFRNKNTLEILHYIDSDGLGMGMVNGEQVLYMLKNYQVLLQQAKRNPDKQLLDKAICYGYSTIVEAMIKSGYKVDKSDLVLAKRHKNEEIGRILIKALYMASGPIAKQFYAQLPENIQRSIVAFIV